MPNKCFTTFTINYVILALILLLFILLIAYYDCCMVNLYSVLVHNDTFSKHSDLRRSAVLDLRFAIFM